MQIKNNAAKCSPTSSQSGMDLLVSMVALRPKSDPTNARPNQRRQYQPSRSKQTMNDNR
jgi:hypothetical protein